MLEPIRSRFAAVLATAMVMLGASIDPCAARSSFRDCADCPRMIPVPAGHFRMGSLPEEPGRGDQEGPVHKVVIGHGFAIGEFDVTRTEFARFVAATGYDTHDPKCDWRAPKSQGVALNQTSGEPVVCVDWGDAQAYVAWLRDKTGKPYRLPSEAEWEFAARAGSATAHPWGVKLTRDHANYGADPCCGPFAAGRDRWLYTSPMGAFPPNRFGLYDMIGNVWQWVADCGHENYADAPADGSAWMTGACDAHMVRGGAWFQGPESQRSASRAADKTGFRIADIGFRVARPL
jgi:formylglycine-generating enzyme required for sulfatase activity